MPPKAASEQKRRKITRNPQDIPRPEDAQWMTRALELARRGEALASPNPMVGAVLVRNGRAVGEGFHTYDGIKHAEILALEAAGAAAPGATLYINLEPCCHTGRTGPCTQALIAAGIKRVVAAMPDPNPRVSGRGFQQLRAAGIEVEVGVLCNEAQRLNEAFSTWITKKRPFVTLKVAMTLDGRTVLPPSRSRRQQRWITSEASRAEVQRMRHASDAILTGIGTVLADDPLLTDRTGLPRRRPLLRVLLDSRLRLSPRSQLAQTADGDVLVFTCANASSPKARARQRLLERKGIEIAPVRPRNGKPDLRAVLIELARRNILNVILEAGDTLNDAALAAGLVDKVRLFYAPILIGHDAPVPRSRPAQFGLVKPYNVQLEQFGSDFAVEAYVHDNCRGADRQESSRP